MDRSINGYSGPYNARVARLSARLIDAGEMTFEAIQDAIVGFATYDEASGRNKQTNPLSNRKSAQRPLDAAALCFLLTCALLMTSSDS